MEENCTPSQYVYYVGGEGEKGRKCDCTIEEGWSLVFLLSSSINKRVHARDSGARHSFRGEMLCPLVPFRWNCIFYRLITPLRCCLHIWKPCALDKSPLNSIVNNSTWEILWLESHHAESVCRNQFNLSSIHNHQWGAQSVDTAAAAAMKINITRRPQWFHSQRIDWCFLPGSIDAYHAKVLPLITFSPFVLH